MIIVKELRREDLRRNKRNLSIDKITIWDFEGSAITIEEICKSEKIIFIDGEQIKVLKNRY